MEKKGTRGALRCKPVATEVRGPGTPTLWAQDAVLDLDPRPMGTSSQSLGSDALQPYAIPLYILWKTKQGWGWSLEQVEHVLSAVTATSKRTEARKRCRLSIYPGSCPFHTECKWSEGCPDCPCPEANAPSGRIWWKSLRSSPEEIILSDFKKRASKRKSC